MTIHCNTSDSISRRDFIHYMKKLGISMAMAPVVLKALELLGVGGEHGSAHGASAETIFKHADFQERIPGTSNVRCTLCPRREVLKPGQTGFCRIRKNIGGELVTYGYDQPCIMNVDPIGKNPLFNFHPEMTVLAIAHAGCNLRCLYCQNWQYAMESPLNTRNITSFNSGEIVSKIKARSIGGISFTYTEPACCPEFVSEFASFCGEFELKRTICTAGFIEKTPLRKLLKHFDAVTITFKGPDKKFYQNVTSATLKPVLNSMVLAKNEGKWLEVATLVVPTLNDDRKSLTTIARWIKDNLGKNTPWILEKFEPQYRLKRLPPTSQSTMETARRIGLDTGLEFVYISNLAPHTGNHTYCPSCGKVLIKRLGFKVLDNSLQNSKCCFCGQAIAGVWV